MPAADETKQTASHASRHLVPILTSVPSTKTLIDPDYAKIAIDDTEVDRINAWTRFMQSVGEQKAAMIEALDGNCATHTSETDNGRILVCTVKPTSQAAASGTLHVVALLRGVKEQCDLSTSVSLAETGSGYWETIHSSLGPKPAEFTDMAVILRHNSSKSWSQPQIWSGQNWGLKFLYTMIISSGRSKRKSLPQPTCLEGGGREGRITFQTWLPFYLRISKDMQNFTTPGRVLHELTLPVQKAMSCSVFLPCPPPV